MQADLLIVGAGTAGLPCAILAAERGATVVVLEKDGQIGGTLHVSAGHMSAAGTRRQREAGIDDSVDGHYDDVMRLSRGEADPALVRLAVEEAPATVDWLHELGFDFAPETPALYLGHDTYSVPRTYWGAGEGPLPLGRAKAILAVLRPSWDEHVAAGRIVPLLRTALTELLVEDGAIVGARAQGPGGALDVRAPSTVLATGGYGANARLFAELTPGRPRLVTNARSTSTGDGIEAARRVGAGFRGAEKHNYRLGLLELEPGSGRGDMQTAFVNVSAAVRPPVEIWVNERGERFVREDSDDITAHERAVLEQPGHRFWLVLDEAGMSSDRAPVPVGWEPERLRAAAEEGVWAWRAATPAEVARCAGIDPVGLERTIASAPRPVEQPPFYAIAMPAGVLVTFGGLAVDAELRVLDKAGRPIPGLYAAGETIGAAATSGVAFCGGMLVTPALAFGRILGRTLATAAVA